MKTTKKNKKKLFIILAIIIVALIAGGGVFAFTRPSKTTPLQTIPAATSDTSSSTTSGSTNANTAADSDPKTATDTTSNQPSSSVKVFIVDASQYNTVVEVRAYAGVTQDGTCTYTFTKVGANTSFTKQSTATSSANTTSCDTLDVPVSEFSSGTWNVTIAYTSTSGTYSGTSASQSITIQ